MPFIFSIVANHFLLMSGMGLAIMGTGVGEGDNRAMEAAQRAVSSPLLADASVQGARGVIINVTGGPDLSMLEVSEATSVIHRTAHEEANIIFGAVIDPSMEGRVKITVIATGFDEIGAARAAEATATAEAKTPVDLENYSSWRHESPADQMAAASTLSISRRPPIEIPLPTEPRITTSPQGNGEQSPVESPLDVPAFLRRGST